MLNDVLKTKTRRINNSVLSQAKPKGSAFVKFVGLFFNCFLNIKNNESLTTSKEIFYMSSNFPLIKAIVYPLLIITIFLNFAIFAFAASGDLDPTFGTGGRVLTRFPIGATIFRPRAEAQDLLIQPDDRIVAVGFARRDANLVEDFALARYNADGTLDTAFGDGGRVRTPIGLQANALAGALQPDGKIVAAGFAYIGPDNWAFALARYLPNGSLDAGFGSGGKVITDFFGNLDEAAAVAVQPDGKIIAAGFARRDAGLNDDFALARYNADGSPDASFGTAGKVTTDFFNSNDLIEAMILQPDGKIVVAGRAFVPNATGTDFALARYNPDGTLDASFGAGGKINTPFTQNFDEYASGLAIQPDNKLIAVGRADPNLTGRHFNFAVARYNPDGTLDAAFDGDGKFVNDFAGNNRFDWANAVAVQGNGKILVAGTAFHNNGVDDFATLRLNTNGSIDTSFNGSGKILTDFGVLNGGGFTVDEVFGIKIQTDGKIVVAGSGMTEPNRQWDFVLARYAGDAPIAPRNKAFDFDGDGKADVSVFRPANGVWYLNQSTNGFTGLAFGLGTDKIVPADYDGDGKTDIAVYRGGIWYLQRSQAGFTGIAFGISDDIPVPADYNGDGKSEIAVFRPSNGTWYFYNLITNQTSATAFGQAGDKPVAADYDGDGKADVAVFRNGTWYLQRSQLGFTGITFGEATDKPVAADYDGDGKADVAVFRPSNGVWYLQRSNLGFTGIAFGLGTDTPTPADYDGDGKTDVAVFRDGTWYLQRSTAGFTGIQFGAASDAAVPSSYIP